MILRPFGIRPWTSPPPSFQWRPRDIRVRALLRTETQDVWVHQNRASKAARNGSLHDLASEIYRECLGRSPRFSGTIEDCSHDVLVTTVEDGLFELAHQGCDFTICPLLTEDLRCTGFRQPNDIRVEVRFCVAILTFRASPVGDPVNLHRGLSRTYYDQVFVPYVRQRLEAALRAGRYREEADVHEAALDELVRSFTDLRRRFPIRLEEWVASVPLPLLLEPRRALRRMRAAMLRDAAGRLGLRPSRAAATSLPPWDRSSGAGSPQGPRA